MSTKITYNSKTTEVANGKIATLSCNGKKMKSDISIEVTDSPLPIEVSTEAEMTALLTSGEVGGVYKYVGETTDAYENGALYVLEEGASLITFTILTATGEKKGTYEAESGMTWGEFVASGYNDGKFSIDFYVYYGSYQVGIVEAETVIENGKNYYLSTSSGSN